MSARQPIESLESRTFLAADLGVAIESTTLADALVVGVKSKAATATVNVSNSGDTAVDKKTKGNVVVSVGLRDANGTVTQIGTANVKASALAKPTPAKAKVKLAPPSTLVEGEYTLVASVDGGTVVPDANTANNSVDGKSVDISVANSDLAVTATTSLSGSVATGTDGTLNISVQNVGNVASKATGVLTISSTINGQSTTLATIDKVKLNIKPGATVNLKPAAITVAGSGDADVLATIGVTLTSTASGDVSGNNAAIAGTLTVTPPPPSPLDIVGIGEKMTFVKTQGVNVGGTGFESGTWTDSAGKSGTYYLTTGAASDGACAITVNGGAGAAFQFSFNNGKTKLGGTTLTFGVPQSSAVGTLQVAGQSIFFTNRA